MGAGGYFANYKCTTARFQIEGREYFQIQGSRQHKVEVENFTNK
jgi:hypothetical protein